MDVAERYNKIKNYLGCDSWRQLATIIKITEPRLYSYRTGIAVTPYTVVKKLETLGFNSLWVREGKGDMLIENFNNVADTNNNIADADNDVFTQIDIPESVRDKILNLPVYDLPAHALIGIGISYQDLPMSYKPLYIGLGLDPDNTVVFRVKGESMCNARIYDGNYVVIDIRKRLSYENKEIMIQHNGLLVIKKYKQLDDNKFELFSVNNNNETIYPISNDDTLEIIGVVKLVLDYRE